MHRGRLVWAGVALSLIVLKPQMAFLVPVCLLASEYVRVAELAEMWSARLTAGERERVFGGTATSVYRLED